METGSQVESNESLVIKATEKAAKNRKFLIIAGATGKEVTGLTEKALNTYCKFEKVKRTNILKRNEGMFSIRKRVKGKSDEAEDSDSIGKDWAGFSGADLKNDLLGDPKHVDLNRNPGEWLPESGGYLNELYEHSRVIARHNLSFKGNEKEEKIEAMKAIGNVLKKIKQVESVHYPDVKLGFLIITLESIEDRKLLSANKEFDELFEVVEIKDGPFQTKTKATYLWQGEYPDDSFYAIVKGENTPIKLSVRTQEYVALYTIYNAEHQRASIDKLLYKCKVKHHKVGGYVSGRLKNNLQKIISKLNSILEDYFPIEYCVKLDEKTNEHYYIDVDCRYGESLR